LGGRPSNDTGNESCACKRSGTSPMCVPGKFAQVARVRKCG
jgi:hypothetical protein